jgi:SAM-dependent methyltransferase
MNKNFDLNPVISYFEDRLAAHGATPAGVDYNSINAMEIRFEQILKVCDTSQPFSVLDFGCGFGAMVEYLFKKEYQFTYYGYDIVESMLDEARHIYGDKKQCHFSSNINEIPVCDYVVESGIFNMRLKADYKEWTEYVLQTLHQFDHFSKKGFGFNFLTKYSDPEYIERRPDLYYADPCYYFDYCKKHFSRNVTLLHDYEIYDFTILVRKSI